MDRTKIRRYVKQLIDKQIQPEQILDSQEFFFAQYVLLKMRRLDLVKHMGAIARERLAKKQYTYCYPLGWITTTHIPLMGIAKRGEMWKIVDGTKYQNFAHHQLMNKMHQSSYQHALYNASFEATDTLPVNLLALEKE